MISLNSAALLGEHYVKYLIRELSKGRPRK